VTTVAREERTLLADLFAELGPDEPTLCAGWTTRDLAAHVVLRERRPLAAAGIAIAPLAGYTRRVQADVARTPWAELVDTVRHPSPLLLGPTDTLINTTEFFVHHEDVRRAQPGWRPRPADARREATMWRFLRQRGSYLFRHGAGGLRLELPDGRTHVVRRGEPTTTLRGPATELVLYGYGRRDHARVDVMAPD
jgi:uncharacterized protein (TIGR03085 family)